MALTADALTLVATVEDELGITAGTETARLERLINIASSAAESYACRVFYRTTNISEKSTGGVGPFMILDRPPINSVTSITYLGTALSTTSYEIHDANAGIVFAVGGSWVTSTIGFSDVSGTIFTGVDRKTYTIVYDGGWYTQNQDNGTTIIRNLPWDIEYAAIAIVSYLRRSMGRDPSVTSESLLGSSISYANPGATGAGGADWLKKAVPAAAAVLDRYKRLSVF